MAFGINGSAGQICGYNLMSSAFDTLPLNINAINRMADRFYSREKRARGTFYFSSHMQTLFKNSSNLG